MNHLRITAEDRILILKALRKHCRSWNQAEEALHEAVVSTLSAGGGSENPVAYLRKTAINHLAWKWRNLKNRDRLDVIAMATIPEASVSAEERAREEQRLDLLEEVTQRLAVEFPKEEKALRLRIVEGMKIKDIAQHMGVSRRTAQTWVTHATHWSRDYIETQQLKLFEKRDKA